MIFPEFFYRIPWIFKKIIFPLICIEIRKNSKKLRRLFDNFSEAPSRAHGKLTCNVIGWRSLKFNCPQQSERKEVTINGWNQRRERERERERNTFLFASVAQKNWTEQEMNETSWHFYFLSPKPLAGYLSVKSHRQRHLAGALVKIWILFFLKKLFLVRITYWFLSLSGERAVISFIYFKLF